MTALRRTTLTVALAGLALALPACSQESAPKSSGPKANEAELRGKASAEEAAKRAATQGAGMDKGAGSSPTNR